jgi:hypothetical protein
MKECIECGIMIEDDARFCRICGAFQRPKDMGRDGRRATRPFQTVPVGAPETAQERVLDERNRMYLSRLCVLGILISVLGIFTAVFRLWYGVGYGIFSIIVGSLAVHYRVDYGDTCLILGAVCTILSSSLPFAYNV